MYHIVSIHLSQCTINTLHTCVMCCTGFPLRQKHLGCQQETPYTCMYGIMHEQRMQRVRMCEREMYEHSKVL